jgi:hypothetical protein
VFPSLPSTKISNDYRPDQDLDTDNSCNRKDSFERYPLVQWYKQYRQGCSGAWRPAWDPPSNITQGMRTAWENDESARRHFYFLLSGGNPVIALTGKYFKLYELEMILSFTIWAVVAYTTYCVYFITRMCASLVQSWPLECVILLFLGGLTQHAHAIKIPVRCWYRLRQTSFLSWCETQWNEAIFWDTPQSDLTVEPPEFTYDSALPAHADMIRILTIHPARSSSMSIRCTLSAGEALEGIREYEALSYCWTLEKTTKKIICNGMAFSVRPNLFAALKALRRTDRDRRLWVDAICINQAKQEDGSDEKNFQIRLMPQIYKSCKQVHVWLGKHEKCADAAVRLIHTIRTHLVDLTLRQELDQVRDIEADIHHALRSRDLPNRVSRKWEALGRILDDPYWTRMWIVQEVLLGSSPVVHIGRFLVPIEFILEAVYAIHPFNIPGLESGRMNGAAQLYALRSQGAHRGQHDLWKLIELTRYAQASNPVDKVYALYGLTSDRESGGIRQPVKVDLPKERLFRTAANELQLNSHTLAVLKYASRVPYPNPDLESWVPDLETSACCNPLPPVDANRIRYSPELSNFMSTTFQYETDTTRAEHLWRLGIVGIVQRETILECGPVLMSSIPTRGDNLWTFYRLSYRAQNIYFSWISMALRGQSGPERADHLVELHNVLDVGFASDRWTPRRTVFEHWMISYRIASYVGVLRLYWISGFLHALAVFFMFSIAVYRGAVSIRTSNKLALVFCTGRRLCTTSGGFLVLAPARTQKGDRIVIAHGSDMPLILRRASDRQSDDDMVFIGEAWIPRLSKFAVTDGKRTIWLGKDRVQRQKKQPGSVFGRWRDARHALGFLHDPNFRRQSNSISAEHGRASCRYYHATDDLSKSEIQSMV